ncbi:thermonuclease family protein [Rhizobium leguminosarum]|uniref:thermonuclease family protein n=1 Tax=Rhizobium leguminosarum TaxID=384 RepID=UPI001FED69C4|nr:hypothetical protein [Rhizobium leguminosarum]
MNPLDNSIAGADQLIGRASVIDGDTIEIAGQRIRLNGIDAPESWQACRDAAGRPYRCGKDAAFALDEFLSKSRPIRCVGHGKDRTDISALLPIASGQMGRA